MNITANAASLDWRTNNKGVWKALVKDMAPDSSVTFSNGLTGTVAGRQVTVESPSMPTGFVTYTTDDNTAVFGGVLYGAGTASDSLEAMSGGKTVRMGSYTFTGNETWGRDSGYNAWYYNKLSTKAKGYTNICTADYITASATNTMPNKSITGHGTTSTIYVKDSSYTDDAAAFAAHMAGKTIYYELATPTTSTETAQSMSLEQGSDTLGGGSFSATYEGTEYTIYLGGDRKYLHRDANGNESIVTGTVSNKINTNPIQVIGGRSKVIDLSMWFGYKREPATVDAFYKMFPAWRNYDIPYDIGTPFNYKGTGVQTIGFNAYNHATGTAELLGGHKYQICGTYTSVSYVDQWGGTEELELDNQGIFTPINNGTLTVVGGNATDTCVHLCWSGYKNFGEREYQWEPYIRNVHNIDVTQYAPGGLDAVYDQATNTTEADELHTDKIIKRTGRITLNGSETWTKSYSGSVYYLDCSNVLPYDFRGNGYATSRFCHGWSYPKIATGGGTAPTRRRVQLAFRSNVFCPDVLPFYDYATDTFDMDAFKAWLEKYPMTIIYGLKDNTYDHTQTTQLPSPINLTYPVNDFGTEQSLPVNTTDLVTTDLHALIRYNTDYMRMNTQLSEIFPTVRSLAQQEQNGEIMKTDGTAPNATVGNAYNLIDRNAAGTERQFSFDTSGGTQDIADGTAIAKKVMGTTLNLNQLVHDTNENTVESVNGNATVSDAVEGQVKHLVVSGDTVVVNQLVHEHVEKTESGTGRIWIKDAFEKEAKGLKVTAPRSVVMNQLVDASVAIRKTTSDAYSSIAYDAVSRTASLSILQANVSNGFLMSANVTNGHAYLMASYVKPDTQDARIVFSLGPSQFINIYVTESSEQFVYAKAVANNDATGIYIYPSYATALEPGTQPTVRDVMLVDLTQYFNGNQTLIDSIQTWDDLVAYDSAFASYAQYNTGTVKGVTPALTLNGAAQPFATAPQEMFGVDGAADEYDVVNGKYTQRIGVNQNLVSAINAGYTVPDGQHPYGYLSIPLSGRKSTSLFNVLSAKYITASGSGLTYWNTDKRILGGSNNTFFVIDSAMQGKTADECKAYLGSLIVYYELATPVVTDVTPVAFDLVSHDNTIFQTSGDFQSGIEATYDGLNQTIALDPAHTYAFNHQYVEDSIITGESSIDCVGTEDNLVDLTQLYAGDATRIAAIHSWASLSSRIHMYRDWLPYNPGEIVNLSATIRVYQHEHAYGVVYDPSQSSPACQRVELNDGGITEVEEFSALPAHNFRRCVMDDLATRHVNYYLDPLDSTKKADGTPSVLTGADGDVMVEIPITHWYIDEDYNGEGKVLWLVSDQPFTGSEIHPYFYVSPNGDEPRTQYVGAYRASLCDGNGLPLNTTEGSANISLGNTATNLCRSIAGAPYSVGFNMATYRTWFARNGASMVNYWFNSYLYLMMVVEIGTLDTQTISLGYTGGLAQSAWCFRLSGRVNYGNGTGELLAVPGTNDEDVFYALRISNTIYGLYKDTDYDANGYYAWSNHPGPGIGVLRFWTASSYPNVGDAVYSDAGGTLTDGQVTSRSSLTPEEQRVIQFQYRGIENPFGEMWTYEDGLQRYQGLAQDSLVVNGVVHYRDYLKNGSGTKTAWTSGDGTSTFWTVNRLPGNAQIAYTDPECTQDSGLKTTLSTYVYHTSEAWVTSATNDYTSSEQHGGQPTVYSLSRHRWPGSLGDMKTFDPRTFFARTIIGNSGHDTYSCDYFVNNRFNKCNMSIHGGRLSYGKSAGQSCRSVENALNSTTWGSRPAC